MLRINDDSDELFRNAAEHYPLKVGEGDWESVRKKLSDWNEDEAPVIPKNGKRFPFILFICAGLFLLTPFKVVDLLTNSSGASPVLETSANTPGNTLTAEQDITASPEKNNDNFTDPLQNISISRSVATPVIYISKLNVAVPVAKNVIAIPPAITSATVPRTATEVLIPLPGFNPAVLTPAGSASIPAIASGSKEQANEIESEKKPVGDEKEDHISGLRNDKKEKSDKPSESKPAKKVSGFYAGLVGGMDISMIKLQEVKKPGFSAGILVGYQINKRFSIETGVMWDRKNYSTDGKYFNPKNIYLPNYSTILYAEGDCNMFEIPINAKYNIFPKSKLNFFVTVGASSYIMKKENYDYRIKHYNNIYNRSYSYRNSSTDLFSVINLSAGMEKNIGKKFSLRGEPYIKVPISKLGIGNMPLQSAGLNAGLIKRF